MTRPPDRPGFNVWNVYPDGRITLVVSRFADAPPGPEPTPAELRRRAAQAAAGAAELDQAGADYLAEARLIETCPARGAQLAACGCVHRCNADRGPAWSPARASLADCHRCAAAQLAGELPRPQPFARLGAPS